MLMPELLKIKATLLPLNQYSNMYSNCTQNIVSLHVGLYEEEIRASKSINQFYFWQCRKELSFDFCRK